MLSLLLSLVLTPRYFPHSQKDLPTQNRLQGLSVARLLLLLKNTGESGGKGEVHFIALVRRTKR